MSDMLGNRRFIASLDSVSSFSNFDFLYFDMQHRTNWGFRLFDNRSFYTLNQNPSGTIFDRHQLYRETGLFGIVSYPIDRYHRVDTGVGFEKRNFNLPTIDAQGNLFIQTYADSFPVASVDYSGDTTVFREFGPISGHRYDLGVSYAQDIKRGGILSNDFTADAREYLQVTSRSLLAARLFVGYSHGNVPNFYYFGGLNTLRGYDFQSIIGNQAAFANVEFRFPLIDILATPILAFRDIRGNLFFDIGGAKFQGQPYTFAQHGHLIDGLASYGYGLSFDFLGLELHWDFAKPDFLKRSDLKTGNGKFRTEFWVGETF
jgi:outer membrane protein assembly factor BamA